MTSSKGNSESYFPETLNFHRGEAEGNVEVEGKLLYLSTQTEIERKTAKKLFACGQWHNKSATISGCTT